VPVKSNAEYSLGSDFGTVTIVRAFENFKFNIERKTAYDDSQPGYNPALEVEIKHPDGKVTTHYAFERFPSHVHEEDKFLLLYERIISDYISELEVTKNDKVVAAKNIEVNHPLHFGGYHLYQQSYDKEAHQYTGLEVVSDTGLNLVYAGYIMLCIGVFWKLWLRRLSIAGARLTSG
jgi:cytochrome c biogenesis protein ResB